MGMTLIFFRADCAFHLSDFLAVGKILLKASGNAEYEDETGTGRAAFFGNTGERKAMKSASCSAASVI